MRTFFKNEVEARSGTFKSEKITYSAHRDRTICLVRPYKLYKRTPQQTIAGLKLRKATLLFRYLNPAFKTDLKRYVAAYNTQLHPKDKLLLNDLNIWIKALCSQPNPFESLTEVNQRLGSTLTDFIELEILPPVRTSHSFEASIIPA